jgi:hypothetical protein
MYATQLEVWFILFSVQIHEGKKPYEPPRPTISVSYLVFGVANFGLRDRSTARRLVFAFRTSFRFSE